MENLLNNLNEQQKAAVTYTGGPQLVIAGAGSGKTRVLTYKILYLLKNGCRPDNIMALTFTNKAARTMRERIVELTSPAEASRLWMGTFHSMFARILRKNAAYIGFKSDYTIYNADDSKSLVKQIIKDMKLDDKIYKPSTVQSIISNAKNALITPDEYSNNNDIRQKDTINKRPLMGQIYHAYCARCKVAGALDFDDILLYTNILFRDYPEVRKKYQDYFQYILVDEYQDTNFAQHMIILQLTKDNGNLFVVGDDAQSIYSFRGANISNILRLKDVYPDIKTFKLEQNYRSTKSIINAANSLIEKNKEQIRKTCFTDNPTGSKVSVVNCFSDIEESFFVANHIISIKSQQGDSLNDFAILYRTNAQSRTLEEALRKRNIAYHIYGGLSFYDRKEVKDAVSYMRLTINPDDDEALRRIINMPSRGIGDTTINKLHHCAIERNVSMWQVICSPQEYELPVNSGTLKKLQGFKNIIDTFIEEYKAGTDLPNLVKDVIQLSGLYQLTISDNTPENISKKENLEEIVNYANQFVDAAKQDGSEDIGLGSFLTLFSLDTEQEDVDQSGDVAKVTLMTAHAAKGLEFKNVIITGVEEDLFPSYMSQDSLSQIEEERRLLYVAITRAMSTCTITYSSSRYRNGQVSMCSPSRFLKDINVKYLQWNNQPGHGDLNGAATFTKTKNTFAPNAAERRWLTREPSNNSSTGVKSKTTKPAPTTSVPSSFVSVKRASSQPADSSGLHTVNELSVGLEIEHSRFGKGVIREIDETGMNPKIVVDFKTDGEKTLLLKFAKFNIL